MSAIRPIPLEEYDVYYNEMYAKTSDGGTISRYAVPLDADPQTNPKGINEKLAKIQGLKDRLICILNRAIQNEAHWKAMEKRLEACYEAETNKALVTTEVKTSGNAGIQKAMAHNEACKAIVASLFKGEGKFEDHSSSIGKRHTEAIAFLSEVKNLYDGLDSASMNLAIQLKSCMLNAKIYGDAFIEGGRQNAANY